MHKVKRSFQSILALLCCLSTHSPLTADSPIKPVMVVSNNRVVMVGYFASYYTEPHTARTLESYFYVPIDGFPMPSSNQLEDLVFIHWDRNRNINQFTVREARFSRGDSPDLLKSTRVIRAGGAYYEVTVRPEDVSMEPKRTIEETVLAGYKSMPWPISASEIFVFLEDELVMSGSYVIKKDKDKSIQAALESHFLLVRAAPLNRSTTPYTLQGKLSVVSRYLSFQATELAFEILDANTVRLTNESIEKILRLPNLSSQTELGLPYYYRERAVPFSESVKKATN